MGTETNHFGAYIIIITSYTMFFVFLGGNRQVLYYAEASWQYELAAQHHYVDVNGHVQLRACLLRGTGGETETLHADDNNASHSERYEEPHSFNISLLSLL